MKSTYKSARWAVVPFLLGTVAVAAAAAVSEADARGDEKTGDTDVQYGSDPHEAGEGVNDHASHPVTAILFPWFAEIIGVLVFFVLSVSRYFDTLRYVTMQRDVLWDENQCLNSLTISISMPPQISATATHCRTLRSCFSWAFSWVRGSYFVQVRQQTISRPVSTNG